MVISQFLTETVLRDHLASYGVHVELGTEPTSMDQGADDVTVHLKKTDKDGNESTETMRASYVVGADGARGEFGGCGAYYRANTHTCRDDAQIYWRYVQGAD